jgi:hypothetical protein
MGYPNQPYVQRPQPRMSNFQNNQYPNNPYQTQNNGQNNNWWLSNIFDVRFEDYE